MLKNKSNKGTNYVEMRINKINIYFLVSYQKSKWCKRLILGKRQVELILPSDKQNLKNTAHINYFGLENMAMSI